MAKKKAKRHDLEVLHGDASAIDDKRVFCRFALPDVPVCFKDLKIGEKGQAVCKDIGGGGAGVEGVQEIKTRTPLEMWFNLSDGFEPMHLLGRAVWSRPSGKNWRTGIVFDKQRFMDLTRVLKAEALGNV